MALTNGLTNYWKCDEASGNLADSVGGITLTNNGSTPFATGKINNGIDFGTANSTMSFNYSGSNLYSGGAFTVNLWVNVRTAPGSGVNQLYFISLDSVTDTFPFIKYRNIAGVLKTEVGRSRFGVADDVVLVTQTLTIGTWYMMTCTYDGTNLNSYLNGASNGTGTSTGNGTGSSTNTKVGAWDAGGDWAMAYVDEIGFWNRALSAAEVGALYNNGNGLSYPFPSLLSLLGAGI